MSGRSKSLSAMTKLKHGDTMEIIPKKTSLIRAELARCGLETTGSKDKLRKRLEKHLNEVRDHNLRKCVHYDKIAKKQEMDESIAQERLQIKDAMVRNRAGCLGLSPSSSLRTTDGCTVKKLLSVCDRARPAVVACEKTQNRVLAQLSNVLSPKECHSICSKVGESLQDLSNKYDPSLRKGKRLLSLDTSLAALLWDRLQPIIQTQLNIDVFTPLGFAVSEGTWKLEGINEAMRVNSYTEGGFFACHKDAQYCPSGDTRSLLSCVIYLNDHTSGDFVNGETEFFFPISPLQTPECGETIKEEIDRQGGLEQGYRSVKISPSQGSAVLFTHDLLHRGCGTTITYSSSPGKLVLKTDILVSRSSTSPGGFKVSPSEKPAYLTCLNHFREAQQQELQGEILTANNLYEKALSLRFAHPRSELQLTENNADNADSCLPTEAWLIVFEYAGGWTTENLVTALPSLTLNYQLWSQRAEISIRTDTQAPLFMPQRDFHYGAVTCFMFPNSEFFWENYDGCCRVAAMYAFFLLGVSPGNSDTEYAVRYDPITQQAVAVSLSTLLSDAFYARACVGSVYKVNLTPWIKEKKRHHDTDESESNSSSDEEERVKRNKKKRNNRGKQVTLKKLKPNLPDISASLTRTQEQIDADFGKSVDRAYMYTKHGSQFIGTDVENMLYFNEGPTSPEDDYLQDEDFPCRMTSELSSRLQLVCRNSNASREYDNCRASGLDILEEDKRPDERLSYISHMQESCDSAVSLCRLSTLCGRPNDVCACGIGGYSLSVRGTDEISRMNSLVFDFSANEMQVRHDPACECVFDSYERFISHKIKATTKGVAGTERRSRVDISRVIGPNHGFNHASCQCTFPSAELDTFVITDYPSVDHVHVVSREIDGKVLATVVYGGVVAL